MTTPLAPPLAPLPFRLTDPLSGEERERIEVLALAANDRYVIDLLEAENLCPYARAGRERGATARWVHFAETNDSEPIARMFAEAAASKLEVVQVIFPVVAVEAEVFSRFVNDVTEALNHRYARPVFASAALHPRLGYRRETASGLISLFRRSPDPTLQWVRLETLNNIYRGRKGGTSFVDLANLRQVLDAAPKRDLYDEIVRTNGETAERLGIDALAERLTRLREETQSQYREVLYGPLSSEQV